MNFFHRKAIIIVALVCIAVIAALFVFQRSLHPSKQESGDEIKFESKVMKLTSIAFEHNQSIPSLYTCDGDNINPPLAIADTPAEAESIVLVVDDPDAPRGDWVHWTVWNIPPDIKEITGNSVPAGSTEGITDFGTPGYGGPCPPSGTHRYVFTVYALDMRLDLNEAATKQDIEQAMEGHTLDKAQLIGLYQRK